MSKQQSIRSYSKEGPRSHSRGEGLEATEDRALS